MSETSKTNGSAPADLAGARERHVRRSGQCNGLPRAERNRLFPRAYKVFTEAEDLIVERDWGTFHVATIAKRLGRTAASVLRRARILGLGGTGRGRKTLEDIARESGYSRSRLISAARAIGFEPPRRASRATGRCAGAHRRRYAFDASQEQAVLDLLKVTPDGAWLRRHPRAYTTPEASWAEKPGGRCSGPGCGTTERRHHARGLCQPCFRAMAYRRDAADPVRSEAKRTRDRAAAKARYYARKHATQNAAAAREESPL